MNEIHRINPPTGVILNERKYPVITNDPSLSMICELLLTSQHRLSGMAWACVGVLLFVAAAVGSQHSECRCCIQQRFCSFKQQLG
jgi:hypothetical protein